MDPMEHSAWVLAYLGMGACLGHYGSINFGVFFLVEGLIQFLDTCIILNVKLGTVWRI